MEKTGPRNPWGRKVPNNNILKTHCILPKVGCPQEGAVCKGAVQLNDLISTYMGLPRLRRANTMPTHLSPHHMGAAAEGGGRLLICIIMCWRCVGVLFWCGFGVFGFVSVLCFGVVCLCCILVLGSSVVLVFCFGVVLGVF